MKREEVVKLISLLVVAYPNYDRFRDDNHIKSTVALWETMFADDDYKLVSLALEKHLATSKWPPSIAEIRDIMAEITLPGLPSPDEAWLAVSKLISLHESLSGQTSRYLPEAVAQAVDTVGYGELVEMGRAAARGMVSKVGLDRVAFTQAYTAIRDRARERAALPQKLQARLDIARNYYADGSEEKMEKLNNDYQDLQRLYESRGFLGMLAKFPELEALPGEPLALTEGERKP